MNLFKTYDEEDMMQKLRVMLLPDERIIAAVYCSYMNPGFHRSHKNAYPGYAALTDRNRFIGCKCKLRDSVRIVIELQDLTRIHVSPMLFGEVGYHLRAGDDRKNEILFYVSKKIRGARFPNHTLYAQILLEELMARQNALP